MVNEPKMKQPLSYLMCTPLTESVLWKSSSKEFEDHLNGLLETLNRIAEILIMGVKTYNGPRLEVGSRPARNLRGLCVCVSCALCVCYIYIYYVNVCVCMRGCVCVRVVYGICVCAVYSKSVYFPRHLQHTF